MLCAYCDEPSEYVLHFKLCRIDEVGDNDETVKDTEVDVCLACGDTAISLALKHPETRKPVLHHTEVDKVGEL